MLEMRTGKGLQVEGRRRPSKPPARSRAASWFGVRVRIKQRGKLAISRCSPIELNKILFAVSPSLAKSRHFTVSLSSNRVF